MTRQRRTRILLIVLALTGAYPGLWALAAPGSFFSSFPGFGLQWIAGHGSYDVHLVRDVGAFYLALAALSLFAARSLHPELIRATAVAWLVFQVPHVALHLQLARDWHPATLLQIIVLVGQLGLVAAIVTAGPRLRQPTPHPGWVV